MLNPIALNEWKKHNTWEKEWWESCCNTFDEQLKQDSYAKYMRLDQFMRRAPERTLFDLKGMSILDIGGGPISLLLRCKNFSRAVVVDPCGFPKWVKDRYKSVGIEWLKERAENASFDEKFDEAWCYNCLQHVQDPEAVVRMARASAKKIRVCEWVECGIHNGHPHNLTKEMLDELFGKQGLVDGQTYFAVFRYD